MAPRSTGRLYRAAHRMPHVNALRVERDGSVLRITLARPDRRNAFDAQLIDELSKAFVDVGRASAVVLAGEGASFCTGADVEWMRASVGLSVDENVADANAMRQMFEAIDACPAPVVARVQGHALGGGAGLVAAADIAIADGAAVFAFSEVKLGIIPAVISPFALAKIGPSAARRYFVTGERFDADTALRIGLVHEVTPDLDKAVERGVAELLTAGPRAARAAKRLVLGPPDVAGERQRAEQANVDAGGADHLLRRDTPRLAAQEPRRRHAVAADVHQRAALELRAHTHVAEVGEREAERGPNEARVADRALVEK